MLSWIKGAILGFLAGLWTFLAVAGIGAMAGLGAWVAGRLLGPLAAAGAASIIVLGAYYGGLSSYLAGEEARSRIESLERANRELERARAAAEEVAAFERVQAAEQLAEAKERAEKLAAALAIVDNEECGLSPDELEAIKELTK